MEIKDYVTMSMSGLAFALSLAATVISLRQKKYEVERTLRSQLTDAIGKLNATYETVEKLRSERIDEWNTPQVVSFRSFYNGQKMFYAKQAVYLAEQIPHIVTDAEYNTLARCYADSDDDDMAIKYYEMAVSSATTSVSKATNMRGYARLLMRIGRLTLGREKFSEALLLVPEKTDSGFWFRGETLQRWALMEREVNEFSNEHLFDWSGIEYERIKFTPRRAEALLNLFYARYGVVKKEPES